MSLEKLYHCDNIIFSLKFLCESKAFYDNFYLSRIIVGTELDNIHLVKAVNAFATLLQEGGIKENIDTLIMGYTEAESVKLFANIYLALRVAVHITIIRHLDMVDIVYPRIQSNSLPIMQMCHKIDVCYYRVQQNP